MKKGHLQTGVYLKDQNCVSGGKRVTSFPWYRTRETCFFLDLDLGVLRVSTDPGYRVRYQSTGLRNE